MKSSFFALASSILVAYATAYTTPVGETPQGNPITLPGADSIVPVGKPFTITWTPTSAPDTVTLVLLRGPGNNIIPMYPIAEKIPNTGTYVWTPSTDLEDDVTHYGIQLIDDVTGYYQYTTQFGVSNPNAVSSSISSVVSSTTSIDSTSSVLSSSSVATTTATTDIPATLTSSAISSATDIPAVSSEIISPEEASTVYHTNIVTVTSCAPTVSNCPARSTAVSTTVAPVVTVPTSAVIKSSTYWSNSTLTTTTSSSGVASTGFAVSTTALPSQFTGAGDKIRVGCAMGAVMVAAFALAL